MSGGTMNHRPRARWLLSIVWLLAAGCTSGETTEETSAAVARGFVSQPSYSTFYYGDTGRTLKSQKAAFCQQICDESRTVNGQHDVERCTRSHEQCDLDWSFLGLYAGNPELPGARVFPAYDDGDNVYMGCGPKAAQNILGYYGFNLDINYVATWMTVWEFPWASGSKQTTPDSLASGLQRLLNAFAPGQFTVVRTTAPVLYYPAAYHLSRGNPMIVMVNGGAHLQVLTGFRSNNGGEFRMIDYAGERGETWKTDFGLRRLLEGSSADWGSLFQFEGFDDYTIITIERN
jgi:hypothetical protein